MSKVCTNPFAVYVCGSERAGAVESMPCLSYPKSKGSTLFALAMMLGSLYFRRNRWIT